MSIEFKLPAIGEGVSSADVAEITVSVGDTLTAEQIVMELETDKAVVELPCPHAGVIEKILVKSGDTIEVGQTLMLIAESNGAPKSAAPKSAAPKEAPPAAKAAAPSKPAESKPAAEKPAPASLPAAAAAAAGPVARQPVRVPPLGEGVKTADIAEITVKVGDAVQANQIVMELETEKAVVELPCPVGGKVVEILVKQGDTIEIDQHILTVEGAGASAATVAPASDKPVANAESSKPPATSERATSAPEKTKATATQVVVTREEPAEERNGNPVPAAPATRRLARQLGVDIRRVKGTGPGGRITRDDVQAHVRGVMEQRSLSVPSKAAAVVSGGLIAPPPLPDFSRHGPTDREALNKIARTAAENLTVSWNVIPHVTHHDRADVTDLENARKRFGAGLGKDGPKVTQTAIVMKALATCLQAFPKFNSSLDPETNEIVFKRYYNIGCAVDTPHGLVVPVVKECDRKSILQIAADLGELAAKARDRKLSIDSMQGATCTVTNLGGIGGVAFTPIVNYPEVCILGMSRGQTELRLEDGKVIERLMLPLSLSYDHRVINGADAARFMVTLCNLLADPFQLLATV